MKSPFRACREQELSLRRAVEPAGLVLAAVLVVSATLYVVGVSREHNYLEYLPPGMSRETGLAYGHQACDWLLVRRWGPSPGNAHGSRASLVYYPQHVGWDWANSTDRLVDYYIAHLDAQHPAPLTQDERQQASVVGGAWFELCPFQQWIHRPLGGGGD